MNYSLVFGIRDDKPNKKGEVSIFIRYTFQRKSTNIPLKYTIHPKFWSKESCSPNRNYPNYEKLRRIMWELEQKYYGLINDYFNENKIYPTTDIISGKKKYIPKDISVESINSNNRKLSVITLFNNYIENGIKNDIKKSTLKIYKITLKKWIQFSGTNSYNVSELNLNLLQDFRLFIINQGLRENSVGKYIKTIKSFLNYCYLQKEISEVPVSFKKMKVDKEIGRDVVHLTKNELEILKSNVFYSGWYGEKDDELIKKGIELNEKEKHIGQIFVFLCSTGCSYVDFCGLTIYDIHIEDDNLSDEKYITIEFSREKSKTITKSIIPIIDITIDLILEWIGIDRDYYSYEDKTLKTKKKILEKVLSNMIKGKGLTSYHPKLTKSYTNQEFNREIKKLLKKLEFNRNINLIWKVGNQKKEEIKMLCDVVSSHTGRRTYITLSLEQGISIHHLMKTTGHSKYGTLLGYNKTSRSSVVKEFEEKITNKGVLPEKKR